MTTEIGTRPPAVGSEDLAHARQAFIAALRSGNGGAPLLRSMLANARLSAEQQAFVDLLLEAEDETSTSARDVRKCDRSPHDQPGEPIDPGALTDLRGELTDLREVNDTLAAALGACRYCWGGDPTCGACSGRGRAGFAAPDRSLYDELVLPAVRRARAVQYADSRPRGWRQPG